MEGISLKVNFYHLIKSIKIHCIFYSRYKESIFIFIHSNFLTNNLDVIYYFSKFL